MKVFANNRINCPGIKGAVVIAVKITSSTIHQNKSFILNKNSTCIRQKLSELYPTCDVEPFKQALIWMMMMMLTMSMMVIMMAVIKI